MTSLLNELPVAVHLASGGDARVRKGGQRLSLNNFSSASVQISGATRYRGQLNARNNGNMMLLVGYSTPLTMANASMIVSDMQSFTDDVPDGTTVYFEAIDPNEHTPMAGAQDDMIYLSFYG